MNAPIIVVLPQDWPIVGGKRVRVRKKLLLLLLLFGFAWRFGVPNLHYIILYLDLIARKIFNRFVLGQNKKPLLPSKTTDYNTRVSLTNIDWWGHMNNAVYLRIAELARVDWFILTQLRKNLKKFGFGFAFVSANVRYRREIRFDTKYVIKTRAIFWDELNLVMEQKFCHIKTGFVYSIVFGKYILTHLKTKKRVKIEDISNKYIKSNSNNSNTININILKSNERERIGFYKLDWYENDDYDNNNNNINNISNINNIDNANEMSIIQERDENDEKMEILPATAMTVTPGETEIETETSALQGNGIGNDHVNSLSPKIAEIETETVYSGGTNDDYNKIQLIDDSLIVPMIDWNDNYQCRNKIPHSISLWMQCLEQSSVESRRNLFT